ncbi:MAG: hypothetical protein GY737_02460 [Desulfobacteraceae bacterium]|nr:hypothetical protein [Desulfobacteraceae bacterium]
MVSINNTEAYKTNDRYNSNNKNVIETTDTAKTAEAAKAAPKESSTIKKDTVTLSKEVPIARKREAMGLAPTGRLSREDFQTVADSDKEAVKAALESTMEALGIDKDQKVSLSLNAKGKIVIKEKFSAKADLEKQLNNDKAFKATFNRLATNTQILDFSTTLQSKANSMSLVSFMNGDSNDSDWNHLLELADTYNELQSGDNPLETITRMSSKEAPFEFVHGPKENKAA